MEAQAKSDGLRLLRAIDSTQAHGQEGTRVDPAKAAHEAGLDTGDVGSDRYHHALHYLIDELSKQEINELQAAIDERREARAGGTDATAVTSAEVPETVVVGWEKTAAG